MPDLKMKAYKLKQKLLATPEEKRHGLVGPKDLWKMKRDFQIAFLKAHDLKPEMSFLDIGCGTLRGGIPIIDYLEKGHYFGIEKRPKVYEEGQKELRKHGLEHKEPVLHPFEDLSQEDLERKFDMIWSFSVLFHMTDEILEGCLDFVKRHLAEDGIFYANVNIGDREDGQWQGFPITWRSYDFYEEVAKKNGLKFEDIGDLESLGHHCGDESQDAQRMLKFSLV